MKYKIYKIPFNKDISFKRVRIGCISENEIFVWDSKYFHVEIENQLNDFFDLALTYTINNDYLELSNRYKTDIDTIKEMIKTDVRYKKYFEKIKLQFDKINYLMHENIKIKI